MCRSNYVDNGLGLGSILCRRVGDGLDAGNGISGQGLEIGLQVFLGEFRGLVVHPNLHARHAAQGDVALNVDLHAGRVLQGILGGSCLDGRVFANVVNQLLAFHCIQRSLGSHRHFAQGRHARIDAQRAQIGVVGHMEWMQIILIANSRNTQHESPLRHAVNLENTFHVADAAFHKFVVDGIEHGQIDVWHKLVSLGIAQHAHHSKGVAFADFLLRLHRWHVAFGLSPLAVTAVWRTATRMATSSPTRRPAARRLGET